MSDAWTLIVERVWGGPLLARVPEPPTRENALASDVRRRILDEVRAAPAIPLSDLRRRVGLGWGAFYHQVRRLQDAQLLRLVETGRRRLVLLADSDEREETIRARGLLRGASLRLVASLIASGEARDVPTLAARAQMGQRTASYHVKRLVAAGLVASASRSRYVDLRATPLLQALLREG